ncbi:MAG: hypothetical protein M1814_003850 [Vezdaea aestivalis]|nr:MAG: hypothetical protein M1814_003850 [Vezdaea aestivalis]
MTSYIGKIVAKKILGETVSNKFGKEDPYFESVPATRLDGRPSKKMKKRRKAIPPGLSDNDVQVLTKVKRRAYRLDNSLFNFCGIRMGWGSVIGLIPLIGDFGDTLLAIMVLRTCEQIDGGLPNKVRSEMWMNIILDFAIGLVPFLGDVADALYRCNTRNAAILEAHLRKTALVKRRSQGLPDTLDPSLPEEYDRDDGTELTTVPPSYHTEAPMAADRAAKTKAESVRTQPAKKKNAGWFTSGSREPDLEAGHAADPPVRNKSRREHGQGR